MNNRAYFSRQLAKWFFHVDWHYTTLLSISIECVSELPDDCNTLINELLLEHPLKPSEPHIAEFLQSSGRLLNWFRRSTTPPNIIRFNLQGPSAAAKPDDHPTDIESLVELADWLSISQTELEWFANFWRVDASRPEALKHYHYQLLEKRDGSMRLIEKPKTTLKRLQRKIYHEILCDSEIHTAAHGFCKKRSCLSHASVHVGKRYLFMFDIAECFQSIGWLKVKAVFVRLGYPDVVSTY